MVKRTERSAEAPEDVARTSSRYSPGVSRLVGSSMRTSPLPAGERPAAEATARSSAEITCQDSDTGLAAGDAYSRAKTLARCPPANCRDVVGVAGRSDVSVQSITE